MQHCGLSLVAYNAALSEFKAGLDDGKWLSVYDIKRLFNAKKDGVFDWCRSLSQNDSKNALHDLAHAVKRRKSGQNKFPKLRRKSRRLSYKASNGRNPILADSKRSLLPKIGWVRMRENLRFEGHLINVTISRRQIHGPRQYLSKPKPQPIQVILVILPWMLM